MALCASKTKIMSFNVVSDIEFYKSSSLLVNANNYFYTSFSL